MWLTRGGRQERTFSLTASWRMAVSLMPTLIFTLVIARILHERSAIDAELYAGLVIYSGINTMLPWPILLKRSGSST